MTESEAIRLIRRVIRQELAPILLGSIVSNQDQNRSTVQRFSTDSQVPKLRNIQPYGVASRAPAKTPALIIPIDGDPTHLNMVGHFDESRPSMQDGETILYDAFGHIVYLSESKMQFGSKASDENMVLGKVFKQWAHDLLTQLAAEMHIGNMGYNTSVPTNASQYDALKASPIDDATILSDIAFTEKG